MLPVPCLGQEKPKPPIVTDPIYAKPQQLVEMDHGRRMNLYCRGSGSPTVVLDAGMGDSTISWALVQPTLAKRTRTCSYDRAGLGFSDAATRPGTVANMAEDLHALLRAAHVAPPYVLVGHSLAGMTACSPIAIVTTWPAWCWSRARTRISRCAAGPSANPARRPNGTYT